MSLKPAREKVEMFSHNPRTPRYVVLVYVFFSISLRQVSITDGCTPFRWINRQNQRRELSFLLKS